MEHLKQPAYRATQLGEALYRQRTGTLDQITTLPLALRESMKAEGYTIGLPEIVQTARSIDGTERYLMRMADGETVETVWMPGATAASKATARKPPRKRNILPTTTATTNAPRSASQARSAAQSTASSASPRSLESAATSHLARSPAR